MPQPALMQQQHWGALPLIIPLIVMLPFRGYSHPGKGDRGLRILSGREEQARGAWDRPPRERVCVKERERQAPAEEDEARMLLCAPLRPALMRYASSRASSPSWS